MVRDWELFQRTLHVKAVGDTNQGNGARPHTRTRTEGPDQIVSYEVSEERDTYSNSDA